MQAMRADIARELGAGMAQDERLPIAVNADSLATWVLPALDAIVKEGQQRGFGLELVVDDQDFTHEWLREGQVLGCVTTLKLALRGCKVLALGDMHYVAVASHAFAATQCPQGLTPHNFRQIPFVAFNRKDDLQTDFVGRALGLRRVALSQRFVPSSEGQVHAVQAGWGASVVPALLVQEQLARGELVNLAPDFSLPISLYWHCWNLDSDVIDRLTQALEHGAMQALGVAVKPPSHKITPRSKK
jgi:LysR family transcriptional regulator (chromosome initiation inhibitor)